MVPGMAHLASGRPAHAGDRSKPFTCSAQHAPRAVHTLPPGKSATPLWPDPVFSWWSRNLRFASLQGGLFAGWFATMVDEAGLSALKAFRREPAGILVPSSPQPVGARSLNRFGRSCASGVSLRSASRPERLVGCRVAAAVAALAKPGWSRAPLALAQPARSWTARNYQVRRFGPSGWLPTLVAIPQRRLPGRRNGVDNGTLLASQGVAATFTATARGGGCDSTAGSHRALNLELSASGRRPHNAASAWPPAAQRASPGSGSRYARLRARARARYRRLPSELQAQRRATIWVTVAGAFRLWGILGSPDVKVGRPSPRRALRRCILRCHPWPAEHVPADRRCRVARQVQRWRPDRILVVDGSRSCGRAEWPLGDAHREGGSARPADWRQSRKLENGQWVSIGTPMKYLLNRGASITEHATYVSFYGGGTSLMRVVK